MLTFKSKVYIIAIILCLAISAANLFIFNGGGKKDIVAQSPPPEQNFESSQQPASGEPKIITEDMIRPIWRGDDIVGVGSLPKKFAEQPVMRDFHQEMSLVLENMDLMTMSAEEFEKHIIKNPKIKEIVLKYSNNQDFQNLMNNMAKTVSEKAADAAKKPSQTNKKR